MMSNTKTTNIQPWHFSPGSRFFRFGCIVALMAAWLLPTTWGGTLEASVESSDPSFIDRIKEANRYKQRYQDTRRRYEIQRADYEAAWVEFQGNLRLLAMSQDNRQSWADFIRAEMRAWARIYEIPERSRDEPLENDPESIESGPNRFRGTLPDAEVDEGWWTRVRNRYQFWRSRYEMVRIALTELNQAREELDIHLEKTRQKLAEVEQATGDSRSFIAREIQAWEKIYER